MGWLIFKSKWEKNEYYYFFYMDGVLILQYVIMVGFRPWFLAIAMPANYDNSASFYDRLSRLVFGKALVNAQAWLLPQIPKTAKY
jgi:hypothetical protein